jgi:hypothetical protein
VRTEVQNKESEWPTRRPEEEHYSHLSLYGSCIGRVCEVRWSLLTLARNRGVADDVGGGVRSKAGQDRRTSPYAGEKLAWGESIAVRRWWREESSAHVSL